MPRPKGSKNKKTVVNPEINYEEQIASTQKELEDMTAALKAKKAELKALAKEKAKADKIAAEKKLEEDKARIMDAVAVSGKSVEEVLELLK